MSLLQQLLGGFPAAKTFLIFRQHTFRYFFTSAKEYAQVNNSVFQALCNLHSTHSFQLDFPAVPNISIVVVRELFVTSIHKTNFSQERTKLIRTELRLVI